MCMTKPDQITQKKKLKKSEWSDKHESFLQIDTMMGMFKHC